MKTIDNEFSELISEKFILNGCIDEKTALKLFEEEYGYSPSTGILIAVLEEILDTEVIEYNASGLETFFILKNFIGFAIELIMNVIK